MEIGGKRQREGEKCQPSWSEQQNGGREGLMVAEKRKEVEASWKKKTRGRRRKWKQRGQREAHRQEDL